MTFLKFVSAILLVGMVLAVSTSIVAQSLEDMQQVRSAETYLYAGRCEEAVAAFRELSKRYPDNLQITINLKSALICNKQFDSAITVIEHLLTLAHDPTAKSGYLLDKADVYLRQGNTKAAEQQTEEAFKVNPNNPQVFDQASNVYMTNGYYPDAVKLLQTGRKQFNDPVMFAKNLGQFYEIMRNYGDAAKEYFQLMTHDTSMEVFSSGKINQLIKMDSDEGFDTGLKEALLGIVKQYPASKDAQLYYGYLLLAQNKLEDAFQRFCLADSLDHGYGKNILYFANLARDAGDQTMVEKACNYILTRYPQSPLKMQSRFTLAQSYFLAGRYNDVLTVYQQIATESKFDRDIADATYAMGYTKLYGLHDPHGALPLFEQLITKYPAVSSTQSARLNMADCHLALGETAIADSLYNSIPIDRLPEKNQEELLFKKAELQFYLGNFEAARDAYGKMMNTYPKSIYVNDCLRRIMLISEYPGMDEATLKVYADAAFARFCFKYDSTLVTLEQLKKRDAGMLTEIAWFDAGEIYTEQGKATQALVQYDSLITTFPESYFTPLALENKGDVYAELNHDCTQAKSTYESILLKYPTGLNAEAVRRKLQRVERGLCAQAEKPKS